MRTTAPGATGLLLLAPATVLAAASTTSAEDLPRDPSASSATPTAAVEDLVVTATRTEARPNETARSIGKVGDDEMRRRRTSAVTGVDYLRGETGVHVQKTGMRGGAPIVRGNIGKFILPVYDGVRLTDGSIFEGPNAIYNDIDPLTIDHVEVLRGPASVLYGSDALGATIQMLPRRFEGHPQDFEAQGRLVTGYRSANDQTTGRLEAGAGWRGLTLLGGATFVEASDTVGGGDEGRLENTSFSERNFDIRLGYELAPGHTLEASYLRTERLDVYRFDRPRETPHVNDWWAAHPTLYLTAGGLRRGAFFDPEATTQIAMARYQGVDPTDFWTGASLTGYWRAETGRTERGSEQPTTFTNAVQTARSQSFGLSPQATSTLFDGNTLTYGVDGRIDDLRSGRAFTAVVDKTGPGAPTVTAGIPELPDATYYDLGAYAYDSQRLFDRLTLAAGLRYNYNRIDSHPTARTTPEGFTTDEIDVETDFHSLTWTVGAEVDVVGPLSAFANAGTGFRAPSTSDTLFSGPSTFGIAVPSLDLDPEESLTLEGGLRLRHERVRGSIAAYHTWLTSLIQSKPSTFQGSSFIDLNGDGLQDPGEQVFENDSSGRGYIRGFEGDLSVEALRLDEVGSFFVFTSFAYTEGRDTRNHEPLRFIPPLYGEVGARWELARDEKYLPLAWVELVTRWADRKASSTFSGVDMADLAQFPRQPGRLPGWAVLGARTGASITEKITLTLSVENIFDRDFQEFATRMPSEGRSANVGLEVKF